MNKDYSENKDYSDWVGESVLVSDTKGEVHAGKVKVAKNSALILAPHSGRKIPIFLEYSEIQSIRASHGLRDLVAPVTIETVRAHMRKFHSWNAPWSSARDLMKVHERMHDRHDKDEDGRFGHVHSA